MMNLVLMMELLIACVTLGSNTISKKSLLENGHTEDRQKGAHFSRVFVVYLVRFCPGRYHIRAT